MDYVAAAVVLGFVTNVLYQYGRYRRLDLIRATWWSIISGLLYLLLHRMQ
jgi:hypothetical protein